MVHYFGIRHLSPAGACYVQDFLERIQPQIVLIEGASDLTPLLPQLCLDEVIFPAAIMAYSETVPIQTVLYPFAEYSPEYQSILWAVKHKKECRFIDLPSSVFLAFEQKKQEHLAEMLEQVNHNEEEKSRTSKEGKTSKENSIPKEGSTSKEDKIQKEGKTLKESEILKENKTYEIYQKMEEIIGEDQESYWERKFEYCGDAELYRKAAEEYGKQLRACSKDSPYEQAETLLRERYMKYQIEQAVKEMGETAEIAVITGAFHVEGLKMGEAMKAAEIKKLPMLPSKSTLMPYSYFRLSKRSGYGAGNKAPAYYELLWNHLNQKQKTASFSGLALEANVAEDYLCGIAEFQRKYGNMVSSAEVIEAVRLADALARLKGSEHPVLADLRDAAVTCMGHGQFSEISLASAAMEIGTKIGSLPEGVSRTLVQEDFYKQLKEYKLEKYKSIVAENLELDLRENVRVKSEKSAFLDLNRSFFLHKLMVLGIEFVKQQERQQDNATWAERYILQWTPEAEIQLIEAALKGDTIELAASYTLQEELEAAVTIDATAKVIDKAGLCGMSELLLAAVKHLQELAIDTVSLQEIGTTIEHLSSVVHYGSIRHIENKPFIPILKQLFYRACLILIESSKCNNDVVDEILEAMNQVNNAAKQLDFIEEEPWIKELTILSDADDVNTKTSGFASAILLERGKMSEELLAIEVERRLSPAIPADLGAGWFEGLAKKNRYALISRLSLWRKLEEYIDLLEEEEFRRALVFLRRAFSEFSSREKCEIGENLGEIWGLNAMEVSEEVNKELTPEDITSVSGLDDFDFGDFL